MAFASVTPCRNAPNFSRFDPTALAPADYLITRTNMTIPKGNDFVFNPFGLKNVKTCINRRKKSEMILRLAADSEARIEGPSLSDVIRRFYTCINKNDRKGLEDLIYRNCLLEDSSFPYVIQGKKEVINLFIQLAESMGENVEFKLGTVCEGDELTASVNWHLEWMDDQIPFSRGCSIFQCTNEGEKLVIRKAQIITESPIKPGIFAMALLKMATSFFNDFPSAAKWILRSPHTILQAMLNMYGLFLAPIINPVLTFYITLWKFIARILGYVISFMHVIGKYFNKKSSTDDNNSNTSSLEIDQGPSSLP